MAFYFPSAPVPVFVILVFFLVEIFIDQKEHRHLYKRKDTLVNILIGMGLILIILMDRTLILFVYNFIYSIRFFTIPSKWYTWSIAFILYDFTYYWYHRCSHTVNWFWASHVVHHSSEHYNASVVFRQSWTTQLSGTFLFYSWLLLLGFDPLLIYATRALVLFYQSWLHTELIGKLHPWFEWLFNTPSHHRVHHASDIKYLDKNHGGVFILWDRLFGTFQDEEEKPTYGLTDKLASDNLSTVMWNDWKALFCHVFSAHSVREAMNYIVQPPGWSPDGSTKTVKQLRKGLQRSH